jgi:hypothetical protein
MKIRCVFLCLLFGRPAGAAGPPLEKLTFEEHVRPILRAHCLECHGESGKPKGKLDLRLRRLMLVGGASGSAIAPGKPAASQLYARVSKHEMPPGKVKLSRREVARIERWIASGAPTGRAEPENLSPGLHISDDERRFWSFQLIRRPAVPLVRKSSLSRTPIDTFLLAKLGRPTACPSRPRPTAPPSSGG